ncbi:MAG TPA: diphosphate--fructose-6-phosphate 1-phosphotransferase [Polyangiaceae bacterium]|nr:diphosphate--fructose-6-phosphate 1-phosphotransferase [Polyangiaceae bacterium]
MSKLGILVGGGPAPGINSVIGAATIRARLSGVEVVGIQEGYRWLMEGDTSHVMPLTIAETSRIHFRGGSTLGTSRANPTKNPQHVAAALEALQRLDVGMLVSIGGDDTCFSAYSLAKASGGNLRVVHVPKTIDNDLDLPLEMPTFGYTTARSVGVGIVQNLMTDAKTTGRWYFVVAMGRKAGHLALGIGKAAGATVSLIPEEFAKNPRLSLIVDTLAGSIIKRLAYGRPYGVAVLAEGLVEILPESDLAGLANVERDEHDHIRIAEVDFGEIVKLAVRKRLTQLGVKSTLVAKNLGYELRCADPVPSDMEYTRDLGYCAARYVIEGGTNALITMVNGVFRPVPFEEIMDPRTGRMRVRMVNLESDRYRIARSYMIRLRASDLDDPTEMARLAAVIKKTPDEFRREFEQVFLTDLEPIKSMSGRPPPVA